MSLAKPTRALAAQRGADDDVLVYTIGAGGAAGIFYGLSAEQGVAAWMAARENLRGYTSFAHSAGRLPSRIRPRHPQQPGSRSP